MGGVRRRNSNKKRQLNNREEKNSNNDKSKTDEKNEKKSNKSGYKAYKRDNKYKRQESYKTVIYPAKQLTEEDIKKEISQTLESHFTLKTTEIEEIEVQKNISFYTDEVEEMKEKKTKIQEEIKKIQQHCQVKEIQYTKAVVPILSTLKEKIENNENLAQEYHD